MALTDPKMSKQGTNGKRKKKLTLTIYQKLEKNWGLKNGASSRDIMDSYNTGLSIIHDIKKWQGQLVSLMASSESVKVFLK